ncbi:MAG TPA: LysM peptidoglycan-binding domain-containing protein [Gemmataceae bacterium]|nr:LysM peptidoglycan-binding domain-containing protein [Gemmataceae bacterium]
MPNDAKLGLVLGVGLVIAVGVVFFRADANPASASGSTAAIAPEKSAPPADVEKLASDKHENVPAQPTARHRGSTSGRRHKVEEGDTLTSLAERYLGDGDRSNEIFDANKNVLQAADDLPVGTELIIPESDKKPAAQEDDANQ